MNVRLLGVFLTCGLSISVAHAQVLQPGLWEVTTTNMQVDGQQLPDLQVMLGQFQNMMTPQMKTQLESQGITLGGQGIRVCLTPEQVQSDDIPLADPKSGCNQQITERSGNQWKFRFSCPNAQGAGVATFASDREFTTAVLGSFNATGVQQKGSMDTRAVWLGQNCGAVKPRS